MEPMYRRAFVAQELVDRFPPQLQNRNKRVVFDISSPPGAKHSGTITVTRWRRIPLPETIRRHEFHPVIELCDPYFSYDEPLLGHADWHLNFSHSDLFCAYGSSLFAQDEMQVAEHPAMASLRHALPDAGIKPLTVERNVPTPILIAGVERRCIVLTDPNAAEGRPFGLYGNHFASASQDAIRRATRQIKPPSISNILAMEAPACGTGRYSLEQIEYILSTAFTGFRAAVLESQTLNGAQVKTTIHTGYWGCGAYGGNRVLMPMLQFIAATWAHVDKLVFHTGGDQSCVIRSLQGFENLLSLDSEIQRQALVEAIFARGYEWGLSDGN